MSDETIEVSNLRKRFGPTLALDGMSFAVRPGQVTGFVGPNGAGKSTTLRVILGLDAPDGGDALICGRRYQQLHQPLTQVGALLDAAALQPSRSARNHLLWLAHSNRIPTERVDAVIDLVGLVSAARRKAGAFSLGMRQRLGIAAALLQPRQLLILDEPTNGLDPQGTREVRHLVADLARDGSSVFVSSHLLSEVEQMCSHLGVMRAGSLVWQGSMANLGAQQRTRVSVEAVDSAAAKGVLADLGLTEIREDVGLASAVLGDRPPEQVVAALVAAGVGVRGFAVAKPRLEDIFVQLTGEGFDVSA
jgi:ABC-2 type transport system ATP-binding protein